MCSTRLELPDGFAMACFHCGDYLSVGPIYTSSNGSEYVCGRCNYNDGTFNGSTYVRSFVYENLAKYLAFPCSHKNCTKKIPWDEVFKHEYNCPFRKIGCPLHSCRKMIFATEIFDHFKEKHVTDESPLEKPISVDKPYITTIIHEDKVFICFILCHNNLLKCGVYSVGSNPIHKKFQVNIYTTSLQQVLTIGEVNIVPYDDRRHCIFWWKSETMCNVIRHRSAFNNLNYPPVQIRIDYIKSFLNDENIDVGTLKYKILIESVNVSKFTKTIGIIREVAECPVCNNYMFDRIYSCPTGHSLCQNCKKKLNNCPSCQATFVETRNFSLEKLTENAIVQCPKEICNFTGTVKELSLHEINCNDKKVTDNE